MLFSLLFSINIIILCNLINNTQLIPPSLSLFPHVSIVLEKFTFSKPSRPPKEFHWQDIKPSKSLEFHTCFDGFECARLSVPLDWNATQLSRDTNAVIAITKKRGKVSTIDPRYGGMVIIHPGGPGNSGVDLILQLGKHFQTILDAGQSPNSPGGNGESNLFFDVASFDPRGINNTTPTFSCFNDEIMSQTWDIQSQSIGLLSSSNTSFEQIWSRSAAFGHSCATHPSAFENSNSEHIGQYINTSPVIRDMVEIIEKHGEWREKDVTKQLLDSKWSKNSERYQAALKRGVWKIGREKLLYWGLSYGTFVGQAFASTQPQRVGRMLLDGVMDADDYTRNLGATELIDTDKVVEALFTQCLEAGQESCPWATNISTPLDLALQLKNLFNTLAISPLSALGRRGPTIITRSDLATMIFSNIYAPMNGFPTIAKIVSELLHGNGTLFAAYKEALLPTIPQLLPDGPASPQKSMQTAILCADGDSLYNLSRSSFQKRLPLLRAQSPLLADVHATIRLNCLHWPIKSKWRYEGPFGGKTAHPILFASQTLDPVTPLQNAQSAAAKFEGAGLIECAGEGHCSIAMPSLCTAKVIGDYFQKGILPRPGKICDVDVKPFDRGRGGGKEEIEDAAKREIRDALECLAKK